MDSQAVVNMTNDIAEISKSLEEINNAKKSNINDNFKYVGKKLNEVVKSQWSAYYKIKSIEEELEKSKKKEETGCAETSK